MIMNYHVISELKLNLFHDFFSPKLNSFLKFYSIKHLQTTPVILIHNNDCSVSIVTKTQQKHCNYTMPVTRICPPKKISNNFHQSHAFFTVHFIMIIIIYYDLQYCTLFRKCIYTTFSGAHIQLHIYQTFQLPL